MRAFSLTYGKTKVWLEVEGCNKCGTPWSHKWGTRRLVPVAIGTRRGEIGLPICGDCIAAEKYGRGAQGELL